jgi:hypothetical protein
MVKVEEIMPISEEFKQYAEIQKEISNLEIRASESMSTVRNYFSTTRRSYDTISIGANATEKEANRIVNTILVLPSQLLVVYSDIKKIVETLYNLFVKSSGLKCGWVGDTRDSIQGDLCNKFKYVSYLSSN